jgi:hypothetical protein
MFQWHQYLIRLDPQLLDKPDNDEEYMLLICGPIVLASFQNEHDSLQAVPENYVYMNARAVSAAKS